jgi:hypothetical protein
VDDNQLELQESLNNIKKKKLNEKKQHLDYESLLSSEVIT